MRRRTADAGLFEPEGHEVLRNEVKASHRQLEEKIDLNASVMKFGFETLDVKIDGVRDELKETREELSAKIQAVGEKMNGIARAGALGQQVSGHGERIVVLERKVA